jgi:murein DD-endopeptidase MepM/ murein hydrolase activator NlpD
MILAQKITAYLRGLGARRRLQAALIMLPCFGVVAAFGFAPDTLIDRLPTNVTVEELPLQVQAVASADSAPADYVREERIQRGDSVATLLARLQVRNSDAEQILHGGKPYASLRQLVPGKTVSAVTGGDGRLVKLRYLNGDTLLAVDCTDGNCKVGEQAAQLERRVLMRSAEIRMSLFGATDAAGLSDAIAIQLADIFSSDIDFYRDLRKGDRFSVIYEVFYNRGEPVRTGRVLAAEFINQGKSFQAVWFEYAPKEGGYYTLEGKNLRKQFLRTPLEFSRITSGYTNARFHPILQAWGAHRGIDYAAPTGTRIRATADGVVDNAGRQGGYGNLVVLRHQSKYTTWYGHMSGFAKGLRKGKRVSQGEVIGYVGATGLATGPHLHYEFRVDGVQQNPLRVAMPAAPPITADLKPRFAAVAQPFGEQFALLRTTRLARLD